MPKKNEVTIAGQSFEDLKQVNEHGAERSVLSSLAEGITSLAAFKRVALAARLRAVQTDTAIVVFRDRKIVHLTAEEIRKQGAV
ncbi:MAG: hypothetical protein EPN21_04980 [Methylococcaceae bacterium]|nr:MAG: hypothetical protein EPN21_04980 [Methylococcaceae bacterium]